MIHAASLATSVLKGERRPSKVRRATEWLKPSCATIKHDCPRQSATECRVRDLTNSWWVIVVSMIPPLRVAGDERCVSRTAESRAHKPFRGTNGEGREKGVLARSFGGKKIKGHKWHAGPVVERGHAYCLFKTVMVLSACCADIERTLAWKYNGRLARDIER